MPQGTTVNSRAETLMVEVPELVEPSGPPHRPFLSLPLAMMVMVVTITRSHRSTTHAWV